MLEAIDPAEVAPAEAVSFNIGEVISFIFILNYL
jgi:hypothetical protein